MKKDLSGKEDIKRLVDAFYKRVKTDEKIGFIFTDIAMVNWEIHLPRIYDFWDSMLFGTSEFSGNPMEVHIKLHRHFPLTDEHFLQWKKLFIETVDELFKGKKADEIKSRALSIAQMMEHKLPLQ